MDVSFVRDKLIHFGRKVTIAGIEESNKPVHYEYKYLYPTTKTLATAETQNYVTNGNIYNDNITQSLNKKLNKFDIILVNGKDKKEFLTQYVKCNSKIYDISNLTEQHEYATDYKNSSEE